MGALLIELADHLDAMVAYWDEHQLCRFANNAYVAWFGRGRQELLGTSLRDLLGPLYALNLPYIEAAYRGERQLFERGIPRPDGTGVRHSLATYIPRRIDNRVVGIFVHVADVEPLKRMERELQEARNRAEELATHDFLTGLPNRRMLDARMDYVLGRAKRSGERFYVVSLDLDYFKSINDRFGHSEGDRFLAAIASRIAANVRDSDTLARMGGDEFILLVGEGMPADGIDGLLGRLLESARAPYAIGDVTLLPGLSAGVACFPDHGQTKDALLLASDHALYEAKRQGRDRYVFAVSAPG